MTDTCNRDCHRDATTWVKHSDGLREKLCGPHAGAAVSNRGSERVNTNAPPGTTEYTVTDETRDDDESTGDGEDEVGGEPDSETPSESTAGQLNTVYMDEMVDVDNSGLNTDTSASGPTINIPDEIPEHVLNEETSEPGKDKDTYSSATVIGMLCIVGSLPVYFMWGQLSLIPLVIGIVFVLGARLR